MNITSITLILLAMASVLTTAADWLAQRRRAEADLQLFSAVLEMIKLSHAVTIKTEELSKSIRDMARLMDEFTETELDYQEDE